MQPRPKSSRCPCALKVALGVLVVRPPAGGGADARLLDQAGRSLLVRHVSGLHGGWAWRSSIQRPHLLTDRDVGAAGVAMGLLRDPRGTRAFVGRRAAESETRAGRTDRSSGLRADSDAYRTQTTPTTKSSGSVPRSATPMSQFLFELPNGDEVESTSFPRASFLAG